MQRAKQHAAANRSNPFEQIRTRKKFSILGKKQKGTEKRITQKRAAAVEKRRDTLLVEYKQMRKSNAFVDRRFGEGDESLTQEEKALMRFQKQRMKELAGSKFTLAEEDDYDGSEFQLTHEGKSLADALDAGDAWHGKDADEDEEGEHGTDLLESYNFGGGAGGDGPGGKDGEGSKFKSKKEIMEEVIAKSKMFKAMKTKQREEDMEETDALDQAWRALSQTNAAAALLRPKGSRYETNAASKAMMSDADKTYDTLARELVFEAKAQAGERTLTKEELADLEQQRLEELEKGRMARETGGDDLEDDFQDVRGLDGQRAGGYAARRARIKAKRREQEEESDSEDSEEQEDDPEDAVSALEARRQAQAAGDHPLQARFRDIAASLLQRQPDSSQMAKIKGILNKDDDNQDEDGDGDEDEDEDEDGSDDEREDHEVGRSDGGSDSSDSSDEEPKLAPGNHKQSVPIAPKAVDGSGGGADGEDSDSSGGSESDEEDNAEKLNMTFTPSLPASYDEYVDTMHALEPHQVGEMLNRIRAYNAAELSEDGRKKLQILYGCIMQHFISLANQTQISVSALDALVPHLVALTPYVPYYSGALSRARLEKEHEAMKCKLKDPVRRSDAWPPTRVILLAKLLMDIYPVSDKRHPVLAPLNTFLSGALMLCPIVKPVHAVKGILISHLLLNAHARSARLVPEVLTFVTSLLRAFCSFTSMGFDVEDGEYRWMSALPRTPFIESSGRQGKRGGRKRGKKTDEAADTADTADPADLARPLSLETCLSGQKESYFQSPTFSDSLFNATIELLRSASESVDADAFEELFDPSVCLLEELDAHTSSDGSFFSPRSAEAVSSILGDIRDKAARISSMRVPVTISAMNSAPQVKQYNPKFEESFVKGKDYDPDRQRAEERRLKKTLRKEERGAIRELRKDASFMANVKDQEKSKLHARLENSAKRAMSFLEQQQADFKSGGQQGMWKKKKKK